MMVTGISIVFEERTLDGTLVPARQLPRPVFLAMLGLFQLAPKLARCNVIEISRLLGESEMRGK